MGRLSELFANPEQDTKRGRLAELLYQRSIAEPAPVPDVRTNAPQVMGGLLGMIDSAKRKVGKNLSDLVNNPDQYLKLIAERLPETAQKMASDPGNFIPGGGMAGTFIGKGAKTWDALKEAEAMKRLAAGEDPRVIWRETQVGIAPWDAAPRSEIADNASLYRGAKAAGSSYADDVLVHPELFNNYQGLKNARVNEFDGVGGSINDAASQIRVGTKADANGTMLHELQHGIQQSEGWARGGNLDSVAEDYNALRARMNFLANSDEVAKAQTKYDQRLDQLMNKFPDGGDDFEDAFGKFHEALQNTNPTYKEFLETRERLRLMRDADIDPMDSYRRLAGEAEARLTQARIPMTMEERLNQYPYDPAYFEKATGVKLGDLITRMK